MQVYALSEAGYEGIRATTGYSLVNDITYLAVVLYSLPGLRAFLDTLDIDLTTRLATILRQSSLLAA